MRRLAAVVAITLLAVLGFASPAIAAAAPTAAASPTAAAPQAARPAQVPAPSVRLDLATMTPRVVTGAGSTELLVTGSVTNTGSAAVDTISVRVQRGPAVAGEGQLRSALEGEAGVDAVTPPFVEVGPLAAGATLPFRYTIPLTGDPVRTLALAEPGTYPLLVNVNGSVGGERSRLASARMLLPVSGLPGTPPADPPVATPFSLLYPIADAPRRIPPVPGQPQILTDDDLAVSFAPGGRLRGLVDALAQQAPTGSPARTATCLAVDPELVATAVSMSGGYEVAPPGGQAVPGRGADAARQWVDDLRATARGSCVLALPASDADLVALVRGGQGDLARMAVEAGRATLASDLGTPVLGNTVWPTAGVLDEPTLAALPDTSSLLLSAEGLGGTDTARTAGVVPVNSERGPVRAVLTDPLLTEAAGGGLDTTRRAAPDVLAGGSGPLSGQDLIGAIGFRAGSAPGQGPVVVAPPHQWSSDGASAAGLLSAVAALIGDGRIAPVGLSAVTSSTAPPGDPDGARLYYPVQAGGAEIPASAVSVVADQQRRVSELQSAAEARTGVGASPEEVFGSLRLGLLRAVSGAWRGRPADADANAALVANRIDELRRSVRVLEPPSPYSLGTSDAPLLLTVANDLPVTMRVRIVVRSASGLRVDPIPEQAVPPLGRVQVRTNAKVTRAGQFVVDAELQTPDGVPLGEDTRLRVRSTVYGTVTVWLTAVAGAVLVVLVVRRVLRRIRPAGGPPPPDGPPVPPAPGPPVPPDDGAAPDPRATGPPAGRPAGDDLVARTVPTGIPRPPQPPPAAVRPTGRGGTGRPPADGGPNRSRWPS